MKAITTKFLILTGTLFFLLGKSTDAQITFTQSTASDIIQNVFAGGGVDVFNITSGGNPTQIGRFTGGNQVNLGFPNGMVMTTGDLVTQSEPNGFGFIAAPAAAGTSSTSAANTLSNDPDLNTIISSFGAPATTNNISLIEFDFIPSGNAISFNYVFASEEYNGFVCSQFFDVFGFFISGPGINGPYTGNSANIAIVPNTNPPLPASINTINSGVSDGQNFCPPGGLNNQAYFVDNSGSQNFSPYGFTSPLQATSIVQPGETYHVKMILANGSDTSYDSWLFVQAQSFTDGQPNACENLPDDFQNELIGFWSFCENTNDNSGNGNNGIADGNPIAIADRFANSNRAFSFDGINDNIRIPNNSSLTPDSLLTISFWFNLNAYETDSTGEHAFISIWGSPQIPAERAYRIYYNSNTEKIYASLQFDNGTATELSFNYSNLALNQWHMIALTYNQSGAKLFCDGVLKASDDNIGILGLNAGNADLYFMRDFEASQSTHTSGKLDDVGIWRRSLNTSEIFELYAINACIETLIDTEYVTTVIYDTIQTPVSTSDTLKFQVLIETIQPVEVNSFQIYADAANSLLIINCYDASILDNYSIRIANSLNQDVFNSIISQQFINVNYSNWGGSGLFVLYLLDPQGEIISVKQIVLQ
jgi:hypothetical protein